MLKGLEFLSPYFALLGLLGLIFWTVDFFRIGKKSELSLGSATEISSSKKLLRFSLFLLGFFSWLLISVALSEPRRPLGYADNKIEVNDIFFVVDISRSMEAFDFKPNRLEAAKKKLNEFIGLRPTDRIGVIIFSEKAYTLLPLSTDLNLIKEVVSEIRMGKLGSGTNIGDALGLAVARSTQSLAKSKIAILLTDGVSNVGSITPMEAADQAAAQGLKVYTIGIGKSKNSKMLKLGSRMRNIPGGSVDLETLQKISDKTGGKHFYAANDGALEEVLEEIQKLEKTEIETSGKIIYKEDYYKFLLFGGILLLLVELVRRVALKESFV